MRKLLLFTFTFLVFVNNAFAHTGIKSSSPQDKEIIHEELKEVTITFDTKLEQNSVFELQKSDGSSVPVEKYLLSENKMVAAFSNPLDNGEYQVTWKIIGADGHPIDGVFSFTVDLPTIKESTEKQEEIKMTGSKLEEKETEKVAESTDLTQQQKKLPSYLIPSILGVLLVVVVGSFLMILRRKK
ncbi:copper resistance protein CopC [Bacillus sp. 31A1R]|uniref:Copper resistance protein CopC n=1 Tax=Robertmurraya mangrovi TaxID=3098077 RepID=A0ABU5J454_9BACI|nr:copper resistance protein CopC [Bacillus sp. 31A1R]MDZ5474177.1 copper resistance protein CopC [Bacillus sp. 31A1R]